MDEMAGNVRIFWKWLDMAGNGWKVLEMAGIADMAENVWKWMEITGNGWDGWEKPLLNSTTYGRQLNLLTSEETIQPKSIRPTATVTATAKTKDPLPANSTKMHSRLVCQDRNLLLRNQPIFGSAKTAVNFEQIV